MHKIVHHTDNRFYEIDTVPERGLFAVVLELRPVRSSGLIASWLEAETGQEQYTYHRVEMEEEEIIRVVLELGYKFAHSKAWKRLYDWAYFKARSDKVRRKGRSDQD